MLNMLDNVHNLAAKCRGVNPLLVFTFTSTPGVFINNSTISVRTYWNIDIVESSVLCPLH